MRTIAKTLPLSILLLGLAAAALHAQGPSSLPQNGALAAQSLRPYWHVFIAYSIAIVLVLGWVVSIGRRLKDVEERLRK
ncbi:MAG TPA: CcmD family protein [Longimicrobiales bacterium]|nr:CcmD family protein [Longimicrobiales bacterium]